MESRKRWRAMRFREFFESVGRDTLMDLGIAVAETHDLDDSDISGDEQLVAMGKQVYETAQDIFNRCGVAEDFGIQHVGASIVFGGTNRLVYTSQGWAIDADLCTPRFKEGWAKISHEYQR